jgi:hypothetical protein
MLVKPALEGVELRRVAEVGFPNSRASIARRLEVANGSFFKRKAKHHRIGAG